MKDFSTLPDGLPVPTDDGKADHLTGSLMPSVVLRGTKGSQVLLDALPQGRTVIYVYPMTGKPGVDLPTGWDEVPGARGCTPESCGFRDNFKLLKAPARLRCRVQIHLPVRSRFRLAR